jgi:N-acetyl-gamma-glutamyl-phosphate reductase
MYNTAAPARLARLERAAGEIMSTVKVAIAGATGYGGSNLFRILLGHPEVEITYLGVQSHVGRRMHEVYPHLPEFDLACEAWDADAVCGRADVVVMALPHGLSMHSVPALLEGGARVIDFGADFRLRDPAAYPRWYGIEHACPELLGEAVYTIPELGRDRIAAARLVACPGCYPTSALVPLAPFLRDKAVDPGGIIIDSKSGVSGAGRSALKLDYHFPEANEDVAAYAVTVHRHTPEIEQEASRVAGAEVRVSFTPHLIPMTRGIFTTIYATLARDLTTDQAIEILREAYAGEPFVKVLGGDRLPHTKATWGSNYVHVTACVDARVNRLILLSALDNLGKGEASQAVQILNVMMGWPETTAISQIAIYP